MQGLLKTRKFWNFAVNSPSKALGEDRLQVPLGHLGVRFAERPMFAEIYTRRRKFQHDHLVRTSPSPAALGEAGDTAKRRAGTRRSVDTAKGGARHSAKRTTRRTWIPRPGERTTR